MNSGDNAWILCSSALVLLMTPGLALFYGGMVRSKNVLSVMMHSFFLMGIASVIWALWGFSLAFGPDAFMGMIGGLKHLGLISIGKEVWPETTIPQATYVVFQCGFAVITAALISGAFAERINFPAFIILMILWITFVYCPVCHWVWGPGGWLATLGVLDFAGGTVVHVNAGMAAVAFVFALGKRKGYQTLPMMPHNLPLTLIGAGLLWIGWFGFNAGSALKANESAAMAFLVTQLATGAAAISWVFAEWIARGKPTTLGIASGALAGLVAITPAAGFVSPMSSLAIGSVAGVICYAAVCLKAKSDLDDTLDVFGIHAVGGAWGAVGTGIFASAAVGGTDGLIYGNAWQLVIQVLAVGTTAGYSFIVSLVLVLVVDMVVNVRVTEEEEEMGLDATCHGETGYRM